MAPGFQTVLSGFIDILPITTRAITMKLNSVRIFALINFLLVGYLFYLVYQLKSPQPPRTITTQPTQEAAEVDANQLLVDALNREKTPQDRLQALMQIPASQLSPEQCESLLAGFFGLDEPAAAPLAMLDLRERAGRMLLTANIDPVHFAAALSRIATNGSAPIPLRNQALILLYQLTAAQDVASPELAALLNETAARLFEDRSHSLAATVLEGQAYLLERHPELVDPAQLQEHVLRGLRDLRSSEAVQLAALQVAAKHGISQVREDAERIARANPSQALTLAALNAAASLGASKDYFQNLNFMDNKLELARLKALQAASAQAAEVDSP